MKAYFKGWLTLLALALVALAMIALASQPAHAAGPWYVAPGGDDGNACTSPGAACATINGALNKPGFVISDTILVATGTYTGTGSEVVLLDKDMTLSGGWDGTFTTQSGTSTIDGGGSRQGVRVNSGVTATVERFTVRKGRAVVSGGGGIYNGGTLALNNSTVSGNTADFLGGGIYNKQGTLTLNSSTVSGNTARSVGGIYSDGTLTLNNSAVSGNTTDYHGGGIYNQQGTLTLNNSTVSGNTAGYYAGGIYSDGTLTLNNSTVSDNTATNDGGGIRNAGSGTVTLQNTILAGNTSGSGSDDCSGAIGSSGYDLVGDTSGCGFTPTTGDLTNIDAKLGPLEGSPGYHPLLPGSPAINAGNPAGCMGSTGLLTTDQRGFPRFGNCDIGAYEMQPIGFSTKTVNQSTAAPVVP